jgi:retron-type reverse transcriptase
MSDWENFLTLDNFRLAWQRILRSKHYQVKDRIGFRVYEANLEANLTNLIYSVGQGVYQPSVSEKIYAPKRPGTVRSLGVLCLADRLVYQAIANIVARKSKSDFEAIVDKYVYAHLLNDVNDEFMIRKWNGLHGQYRAFQQRFKELWERGNHWIVQADIASYYDSIDHELMCNYLRNRWLDSDELIDLLRRCLREWSPHDNGINFSRGIPQGYEASDYLATVFLLPTDEQMIQRGHYLRYVDDIRVLAPDRDTANRYLLELDVALKKQALILQPEKTGAREITDINEEIDELAGTLSMIDQEKRRGENVDEEAEELFFKSWHTLEQGGHVESHLFFALYRIPLSRPARNIAIKMLRDMPWRSNSITSYLREFNEDEEVINTLIGEITNHKVYAWHLANCIRALSKTAKINVYRNVCRDWIGNRQLRWYQRLAAVECLQYDPESFSFLLLNVRQEPNYLVRSALIVAAAFSASTDVQRATVIRTGLHDNHPQIIALSVWLFLEFQNCGVDLSEFGPELGIHRNMIPAFSGGVHQVPCYIAKILNEIFKVNIPIGLDFRTLFAPDYDQAVTHIRRAVRYHDTDPVAFVTSIDNFNQVAAIKVSEIIDGLYIPRDSYGNILHAMNARHSIISTHFLNCHELRSQSQGPHAWATSLGTWSQDISHRQKENLIQNLRAAYQQLIDVYAVYQGIPIP